MLTITSQLPVRLGIGRCHGSQRTKLKTAGPPNEGSDSLEHLAPLYGGEPKAVSICIVITGPTAMAFDEWSTSKLFQAGPRGRKGLARTFGTSAGVLWNRCEACQRFPPQRPGESGCSPQSCKLQPYGVSMEHTLCPNTHPTPRWLTSQPCCPHWGLQ